MRMRGHRTIIAFGCMPGFVIVTVTGFVGVAPEKLTPSITATLDFDNPPTQWVTSVGEAAVTVIFTGWLNAPCGTLTFTVVFP